MSNCLKYVRDILKSPLYSLFLLVGLILIVGAFLEIDTEEIQYQPKWWLSIIGILLIITSLILYYFSHIKETSSHSNRDQLRSLLNLKFGNLKINILIGRIEATVDQTKTSGFIIPIDSSFSNDCISYNKSVAHALFSKFHMDRIGHLMEDIKNCLDEIKPRRIDDKQYVLGTTVILPEKYNTPARYIITASAAFNEQYPAAPEFISASVCNVFKLCSVEVIDTLFMPIVGSGRGGIEINEALINLLSSIKFYSKHSPIVKHIKIYVLEESEEDINTQTIEILNNL